jgi:hypothetical protein
MEAMHLVSIIVFFVALWNQKTKRERDICSAVDVITQCAKAQQTISSHERHDG